MSYSYIVKEGAIHNASQLRLQSRQTMSGQRAPRLNQNDRNAFRLYTENAPGLCHEYGDRHAV